MAHVTIVRPRSLFSASAVTLNATPPISLAYLAGSLCDKGHKVKIIDAVGEAIDQYYPSGLADLTANGLTNEQVVNRINENTEVVAISCLFTHEWPNVRDLAEKVKERFPKALLICGGEHITAEPVYSLTDCGALDYAALGEGEETIVDLANALDTGRDIYLVSGLAYKTDSGDVAFSEPRKRIAEIDDIPLPRWDLTPIENYLENGFSFGVNRGRTMPMLATRGCPYQCTFCSSPNMWTTRWVARKPELVADEIEIYIKNYDISNVDFYDLTAVVRKDWIISFAQQLIDRKLNITWQLPSGTRSEALDREVLTYLYESGCRNLSYAPESGSPRVLKRIKKKVDTDRMIDSMRTAVACGLNVKANIIFGFPDETHTDIWRSLHFISRMAINGINDVSVWTFSPYPGTEMYSELKKKGDIADFNDDYFAALLSYADLKNVVSWDEKLSARYLKLYRLFGLVLFYSVSYLCNPLRLLRTLRNIIGDRHESRMEMTLSIFLKRLGLLSSKVTSQRQHKKVMS